MIALVVTNPILWSVARRYQRSLNWAFAFASMSAALSGAAARAQPAPAPAPAAAPAPAPAAAPARRQMPPGAAIAAEAWLAELPTVEQVDRALANGAAAVERAERSAAFAVLADYVEVQAGIADYARPGAGALANRLSPAAKRRWSEYVSQGYRSYLTASNGSLQMFADPAFRRKVLGGVLAAGSIERYEAARRALPHAPNATRPTPEVAAERIAAPRPAPEVARWAAEVKARASTSRTDLTVLGIPLAAPLDLPTCASVTPAKPRGEDPRTFNQLLDPAYLAQRGTDMKPTKKCVLGGIGATPDGAAIQLAAGVGVKLIRDVPPGAQRVFIHFTPSDRPSWFFGGVLGMGGTRVSALVVDGYVAAVEITGLSSESSDDIVEAVQGKFVGVKPTSRQYSCSNKYQRFNMSSAVWAMGHVTVTYDPGCDRSSAALTFDTSILEHLRGQARRARQATEPRL